MFSDNLKALRNERHITQQQLADALGLSRSTIGMYEKGEREPDFETSEAIADYFNVRLDDLVGRKNANALLSPTISTDTVTFPVIGEIAAGYNHCAVEDWSGETVEIPTYYLKGRKQDDFFVLSVKGDSMYPLYMDGDKVLILRQSTLNHSGEIGAIVYDDYATLKKVEYVNGEDWLRMVPINPQYPPKRVEGAELEQCKVLGIPKLLIREINE
ncbi:MAG: XRE family transcriptional regulator [Eubacterium sp.]|nr:XRE family transcriptional regulator [Eubacterium sp.]